MNILNMNNMNNGMVSPIPLIIALLLLVGIIIAAAVLGGKKEEPTAN